MTVWILTGVITAAVLAASLFIWHKAYRNLKKMDEMLDSAIDGNFTEQEFSEEQLSKLESKMYRYLSEQEIQKKQLEEERANIGRLIGDISHQTQTPLSNVLLYTQLLAESQSLGKRERSMAEKTAQQAEKLSFLIAALVKTSRLENNVIQVNPKQGNVNAMLSELYESYAQTAAASYRHFLFELPEQELAACFDRKWTMEAIGNLVDNAIKYTKEGGSICLKAFAYEMFVRIDVSDDGPGIAESEQAQIFTRFYRSQEAADEKGVGIGLYLAREILSREGGYIKLKSKPGEGSCFSVFLPKTEQ